MTLMGWKGLRSCDIPNFLLRVYCSNRFGSALGHRIFTLHPLLLVTQQLKIAVFPGITLGVSIGIIKFIIIILSVCE